ncbi:hypothetical protein MIR68_000559 [Amoeboaphelidium protococcarum]|nr:hypothetical protein MIR68_000559 [Amoeboaphelidium protococcarum]
MRHVVRFEALENCTNQRQVFDHIAVLQHLACDPPRGTRMSSFSAQTQYYAQRHLTMYIKSLLSIAIASVSLISFTCADLQNLLKDVNSERAKKGAQALCMNDKLNKVAQKYAQLLDSSGTLSHTGPDGSVIGERLKAADFVFSSASEVLAKSKKYQEAVGGWVSSPSHSVAMFDPKYLLTGVGNSNEIWVMVYATADNEKCTPGGGQPEPLQFNQQPAQPTNAMPNAQDQPSRQAASPSPAPPSVPPSPPSPSLSPTPSSPSPNSSPPSMENQPMDAPSEKPPVSSPIKEAAQSPQSQKSAALPPLNKILQMLRKAQSMLPSSAQSKMQALPEKRTAALQENSATPLMSQPSQSWAGLPSIPVSTAEDAPAPELSSVKKQSSPDPSVPNGERSLSLDLSKVDISMLFKNIVGGILPALQKQPEILQTVFQTLSRRGVGKGALKFMQG